MADRADEKPGRFEDVEKYQQSVDPARKGSAGIEETILNHSHDADDGMAAFADESNRHLVLDEATSKRILRKIDWHLMPLMCLVYGLNFLDKTTLSYASITGLVPSLGLVGDDYQWLGSLFYFGYLAWEYPTSRLLQRLPLGRYSAVNVMLWGAVVALFASAFNFSGAVALRFFLGIFEAAVTPGFALITSQWYTTSEQGTRIGIWFSFNGFAQIFGGLVAYGIDIGVERNGAALPAWKIIFLTVGLLTFATGVAFWFIVPDNQLNARWLTKEERILAIERIRANNQGVGNKHFKVYQFKEALLDPMTWAFFFYALLADIPNGGLSNFFSLLIVSFGYTPTQSLYYGTPGGGVEVVTLLFFAFIIQYYPNRRILVGIVNLCISLLGVILIASLSNTKGRLAGYYLALASGVPFVVLLSLISTNIAGYTKKTTIAALFLIGYCVGNIIGPQTFRPKDAPHYIPAIITMCVCWGVCILILIFVWVHYMLLNKKKTAQRALPGYVKLENQEFLDLTDLENPEFSYVT